MKTILYFILLIALSINVFSQSYYVSDSTQYKYYFGTAEPDSNWRKQSFNDSAWQSGNGSIGYRVNGIKTQIQKTTSVYLRYKFTIKNKAVINTLGFSNDYNDGYVAYLNGVEISRTNLGKPGVFVPFNRVTERTHKTLTMSYPSYGYYIDYSVVKQCLDTGMNMLTVQVHNDSINGSDLSFVCWLEDITNYYGDNMGGHFYRQVVLDSTKFPIVIISTDSDVLIKGESFIAKMGIINKPNGLYNKPSDGFTDYNGRISIKVRGQSSAWFLKKSYDINTEDSVGNNNNVPLLGMPKENDWILTGPFADKSQIRNELAFNLGRRQGHYEPRTKFCELILNGDFMGLYFLTEKIKRDSDRVNVAKLKTTDNSGDAVTGGYIIKYDKDMPDSGLLIWVYPKKEDITLEQKKYIFDYMTDFYSTLDKTTFSDSILGYKPYIDIQSLIDYVIAEEAMKNCDAYMYSTYLYKENITNGGKVKYGPLWADDLAFGNGTFQDGCNTYGWQFDESLQYTNFNANNSLQIMKIMRDTNFTSQFRDSWQKVRKTFLNTDSMMAEIDSLVLYIHDAQIRNYEVWPVMNYILFGSCNWVTSSSYDIEISNLKTWLTKRLTWIDNNIDLINKTTDVHTILNNSYGFIKIYPNPFINSFTLEYNSVSQKNINCSVYNVFGQKVYSSQKIEIEQGNNSFIIENNVLLNLSKGVYLLVIYDNGNILNQTKLVKE